MEQVFLESLKCTISVQKTYGYCKNRNVCCIFILLISRLLANFSITKKCPNNITKYDKNVKIAKFYVAIIWKIVNYRNILCANISFFLQYPFSLTRPKSLIMNNNKSKIWTILLNQIFVFRFNVPNWLYFFINMYRDTYRDQCITIRIVSWGKRIVSSLLIITKY